jgi:glycosyltransferase involved in cell wall biosynthesis
MRLLIVSHTPHYRHADTVVGWGPTVREIDHLADLFDEVIHLAPLHPDPAPASSLPYRSPRVHLRPVPPAGGHGRKEKLGVLAHAPVYLRAFLRELPRADVVHVRCPAAISLFAVVALAVAPKPRLRWIKYAGNWRPAGREPWSYAFQRWWLERRLHGGVVTVNGQWPGQPARVHAFLNPCLTDAELDEARRGAGEKQWTSPVRLISVGRLEKAKGVFQALEIVAHVEQRGLPATLDLVGDGPERAQAEQKANDLGIRQRICFHGWLPRTALTPLYSRAHLLLLPTASEGWPKVVSEAMAYGVVPIASSVSSIPESLRRFATGRCYAPTDVEGFSQAVLHYSSHPREWEEESANGIRAAEQFTYTHYLKAVAALLQLPPPGRAAEPSFRGQAFGRGAVE